MPVERCPTCKRAMPRRGANPKKPLRDTAYRKWLRTQPCIVVTHSINFACSPFPPGNDAAHTQNNGMRSKGPDSSCVPLCRKHHTEYDAGRAAFEKKYGANMRQLAAEHYARYQMECGRA